jgi:predicted dehydrogenase
MAARIGVGVIGVAPGRSWAAIAHIPALRALPAFEVRALGTTRMDSAQAAAEAFGVAQAFDNHADLVNAPGVDLVAVTVKVPHHRALVLAALEAGKHVYCEWPLGNGLAEAEEMAALAKAKGVHAVVGLQARTAPVMGYVRDLVADGYVGRVLSTTLVGSGMNWGAMIDPPNAYTADRANGATMLSIPFGHTIDAVCQALGEFTEVEAVLANRRTRFTLVPDNVEMPMTAHDQVLVQGRLGDGITASIHYRGGMPRGTGLLWEINGTEGDLRVTAMGGHAQLLPLSLSGARGDAQALEPMEVPDRYLWTAADPNPVVQNVAQVYALLAGDIAEGTHKAPTFEDAVRRHRLLDAIERAAESGRRQSL